MPVPSTPNQLRAMLAESLPSISANGIQETVSTAIFLGSRLAGLGMTYLRLAPVAQLDRFLKSANVRMGSLGDPNGGRVYENYYPASHGKPPCVPRANWSCWVAANDPWEP
jgi:hypothetical protein